VGLLRRSRRQCGRHKVKRLVIHPGKRLSYQLHHQRAEHWFIVAGTATVTLDAPWSRSGLGRPSTFLSFSSSGR